MQIQPRFSSGFKVTAITLPEELINTATHQTGSAAFTAAWFQPANEQFPHLGYVQGYQREAFQPAKRLTEGARFQSFPWHAKLKNLGGYLFIGTGEDKKGCGISKFPAHYEQTLDGKLMGWFHNLRDKLTCKQKPTETLKHDLADEIDLEQQTNQILQAILDAHGVQHEFVE